MCLPCNCGHFITTFELRMALQVLLVLSVPVVPPPINCFSYEKKNYVYGFLLSKFLVFYKKTLR